ncbi:MAG: ROK family protein [bacterium]
MTRFETDKRIVLTLDAGGTNFVFSAIQGNREVVEPVTLPSSANNLVLCLSNIVSGFEQIKNKLEAAPSAISFAFPGPADYPMGIIGDLFNLPAFRGGIALGPMLEDKFQLPVFINNDGDLFVYGEAVAGFLPYVNNLLAEAGSPKRYKNLFGVTLGTGFGAGLVRNGDLYIGDNSCGTEIWLLRNKINPRTNAEEGACIRAVQRVYTNMLNIPFNDSPSPKDIYEIGKGTLPGNKDAAIEAYRQLGESVGDSLSQSITLLDTMIVIGGGIAGASDLFMPALISEMNGTYENPAGEKFPRLAFTTYNLEDKNDLKKFLTGDKTEITVPGTNKKIVYDPQKRIGVGISKLGTSSAVSIGAYVFALHALDKK